MINGERCKLVTSMDELCVGAIVWSVDCAWCGERHRGIIVGPSPFGGISPDGSISLESMRVLPASPCAGPSGSSVGPSTVRGRRLYRVIDTADSSASTPTDRKVREKV